MTTRSTARLSQQSLGVLLVVVSAAGFGSGPLLVQPLYSAGMEPLAVLFWRFLTAALFSWGFLALTRRNRASLRAISRRRIGVLVFLGVLYVGNSYAFIASLSVVPITLVSIIGYLYPVIVAVLAIRLVRRLEGRRAIFALGIAVVGVMLALGGIPEGELPPLWGLALAVANPIIYAVWIIIQSRLAGDRPNRQRTVDRAEATDVDRPAADAVDVDLPPADAEAVSAAPDPAPAAAIMTTATAAAYAALLLGTGGSISPSALPTDTWLPILGMGLIATALAIQTFYAGVRRIGGARASLISTVEPIYTIVLAMLLFDERLAPIQIVGGVLVIGAVILAETGRPDASDLTGDGRIDRVDVRRPPAIPPDQNGSTTAEVR